MSMGTKDKHWSVNSCDRDPSRPSKTRWRASASKLYGKTQEKLQRIDDDNARHISLF